MRIRERDAERRSRQPFIQRLLTVVAAVSLLSVAVAVAQPSKAGKRGAAGSCLGKAVTISGTAGADTLSGTGGDDVIAAAGGADRIRGKGGDDLICGGAGKDRLLGEAGNDRLDGGSGKDRCDGGAGSNDIVKCEVSTGGKTAADRTDDPPVAVNDHASAAEDDAARAIDVLANDTDVDGGPKSIASVTQPKHGLVTIAADGGTLSYAPDPDYCNGASGAGDGFSYTLNGGSTATVSVSVACVDDPPVAVGDAADLVEDAPASAIDVLANDTDVDGGPKSIASVSQPADGAVAITGGGTGLTYQPASDSCGEDSFGYALNGGSTGKVSLTIACVDDPPVAVGDAASLDQGDPATAIDVLANDTDVDGGAKSIASVSQPADGAVAITGGGTGLTYQPGAGYCNDGEAADDFSYTLNGGSSAQVAVAVACVTTVSISPELSPPFDPDVSDYTVRCPGTPLDVTGRTAEGASVSIDGQAAESGAFQATVPLAANQEFGFSVTESSVEHEYFVRCLPSDFPAWNFDRLQAPSHEFYVATTTATPGKVPYAVIFDSDGSPVWWQSNGSTSPIDASVLADGSVAYWAENPNFAFEIHALDGTLLRTVKAATGSTDFHEFQQSGEDFYLISYQPREHVDLTAFGGGLDDTVLDCVVEEIGPSGELDWSWSTEGHVGLAESGRWWPSILLASPRDVCHMNAIEPVGSDAILISDRHNDAIYKIDKATGEIVWKLGGTWTPKSLTVLDDPHGDYPLGGQHDIRLQGDGTITLHDNRTGLSGTPRAVRYSVDEGAHTATLVEEVTDPEAPSSFCCGSARRSADGSWLMSWGSRSQVTEFNAADERTFNLGFGGTAFSYRAVPAPDGVLDPQALRAGMDSMHPR